MACSVSAQLLRGDSYQRHWTFYDTSNAPMDLTGCVAEFGITTDQGARIFYGSSADTGSVLAITAAEGGVALNIPGTTTEAWMIPSSGTLSCNCAIRMQFADGTRQTFDVESLEVTLSPVGT